MENNNVVERLKASATVNNELVVLVLTEDRLRWDVQITEEGQETSDPGKTGDVPVNEIIAVTNEEDKSRTFTVHFISRQPKCVWTVSDVCFKFDSDTMCQTLKTTIEKRIQDPELNRPKRLLVLVNPSSGGGGKSTVLFNDKLLPLFKLAGVDCEVYETTHGGHQSEILENYDLTKTDGILAVGGDGTFSKVMNSVLRRTLVDSKVDVNEPNVTCPRPQVRVAQIPGGSADVHSEFYFIGTRDPVTTALHIILGDELCVDVASVHQHGELVCFFTLMIDYGAIGDMISYTETDFLRKFGPLRYLYGLTRSFINKRRYHAKIEYVADKSYKGPEKTPYENEFPYRPLPWLLKDDEHTYNSETGTHTLSGPLHDFVVFPMGVNSKVVKTDPRPHHVRVKDYMTNGILGLGRIGNCTRGEFMTFIKDAVTKNEGIEYEFANFFEATEVKITVTPEGPEEDALFFQADGEGYHLKSPLEFSIKMHKQCLRIFSRGLEEEI